MHRGGFLARSLPQTAKSEQRMTFFENTEHSLSQVKRTQRQIQASAFPNQISAGSFTPHSTIVEVSCFHTKSVRDALKEKDLMPVRRDLQVLCHEMTHWLDFFGTIWGRSYIKTICTAYRAFERRTENEFPNIIRLFDEDRSVLSPAYYRFTNPPSTQHSSKQPWSIDYVTGAAIDPEGLTREDRPIFMARYGENPSRRNFARQPVSVGALLEVRAIASEIGAAISAINSHKEVGPRVVEMNLANSEFNQLAYNHDLIEYNTAAHIVSQQSGSSELYLSSLLAAELAYIALNMTATDFQNLRPPESFGVFGPRNKYFKKRQDRGYAFACMAFNGGRFEGNETSYIERCVSASNLGSVAGILDRASVIIESPFYFSEPSAATSHFFRETSMSGTVYERFRGLPRSTLTLEALISDFRTICPPFMDADATFIELNKGRLDEYQPEMMHDASHALHDYTRNLLTGCRGI
jgi:hypothetical protein